MTDEEVETLFRQANELPNLQLLDGSANIEKQAQPPPSWQAKNLPNEDQRRSKHDRHLLGDVPDDQVLAACQKIPDDGLIPFVSSQTNDEPRLDWAEL